MNPIYIGAHTSTQGGLYKALEYGEYLGALAIQIFTRNQRQWESKPLGKNELDLWYHTREKSHIKYIISHASYLINLGSNRSDLLERSRRAFIDEIGRCLQLGIDFLVFHPGAATGDTTEACLDRIVESILSTTFLFQGHTSLRLLIETTAGQGSVVGKSFEELAYLMDRLKASVPIGICLDTCHVFAAGYDLRTPQALRGVLEKFDQIIGLDHLYALHINDSLTPFSSQKDRHANLEHGFIGLEGFKAIVKDPKLNNLPMILETPNGHLMWKKEIDLLKALTSS